MNKYNYTTKEIQKKISRKITNRFNVLIIIMVIFSLVMINQVYHLTIVNNEAYITRLQAYNQRLQSITTPRGEIYDRNGNLIVGNKLVLNITYLPLKNTTLKDMWSLAEKFNDQFSIDETGLNTADLQDLYYYLYPDDVKDRITDEEKLNYKNGQYTESQYYRLMMNKITEDDFQKLTVLEKKIFTVYQAMNMPSSGTPKVILEDVTQEEVAYIIEHMTEYPGFDTEIGWVRTYPNENLLRSVLGRVSSSKQGIPGDNLNYYLALGYSRNDRVGLNGLELYYEDILKGEKEIRDITTTEDEIKVDVISEGTKGDNLKLSIDLGLQKEIERISLELMQREENNKYRKYFNNLQFVAMDPNTGDVLASSSLNKTKDGYYFDSSQTYLTALIPGSAIKGAMVYFGLSNGYVKVGEQIVDTPVKVLGSAPKSSYNAIGIADEIKALSHSSNVYMMHIALRSAQINYYYDVPIGSVNKDHFNALRNAFSKFGLGLKTGIDVPYEETGYAGGDTVAGHLLDFSFGQYETYTTMQLAQYVSTIANGGSKIQPRLLIEAYQQGSNLVSYENTPVILDKLTDTYSLSRVQEGFRACVTVGICGSSLDDSGMAIAAKTGTAENTIYDEELKEYIDSPNSTLVAYGPYEKPTIAVSCAAINSHNEVLQSNICVELTREVLKYYNANK